MIEEPDYKSEKPTDEFIEEWLMWLLLDSALPTGGFVASSGLESAYQSGVMADLNAFKLYIKNNVANFAYSTIPFVRASNTILYPYFKDQKYINNYSTDLCKEFINLDDYYHNSMLNNISRRASLAQGAAFITLLKKSFSEKLNSGCIIVDKIKIGIRQGKIRGHLASIFGLSLALLGINESNFKSN